MLGAILHAIIFVVHMLFVFLVNTPAFEAYGVTLPFTSTRFRNDEREPLFSFVYWQMLIVCLAMLNFAGLVFYATIAFAATTADIEVVNQTTRLFRVFNVSADCEFAMSRMLVFRLFSYLFILFAAFAPFASRWLPRF